jgi:hypothetical protein
MSLPRSNSLKRTAETDLNVSSESASSLRETLVNVGKNVLNLTGTFFKKLVSSKTKNGPLISTANHENVPLNSTANEVN